MSVRHGKRTTHTAAKAYNCDGCDMRDRGSGVGAIAPGDRYARHRIWWNDAGMAFDGTTTWRECADCAPPAAADGAK